MRIGIDASILAENNEGIGSFVRAVLEELNHLDLTDRDNQIIVFTTTSIGKLDRALLETSKVLNHIEVDVTPGKLFGYRKAKAISTAAKKQLVDVLLSPESHYLPLLFWPTVWLIHDISPIVHPEYFYEKPWRLKYSLYKFIYKAAVRSAKLILTTSRFVKTEIVNYYKLPAKKIKIIGAGPNNWVDLVIEADTEQEVLTKYKLNQESYFLNIGTISPRKNIVTLLDAYVKFLLSHDSDSGIKPPKLVISGKKGWLYEPTFAQLEKLKLQYPYLELAENIVYTDYISNQEAKALTKNCIAMVYPSYYEGFGMPPLEAILLGREIILSEIPVFSEIYAACARFFSPSSADELAAKLSEVIFRRKLNTNSVRLKIATQYNWQNVTTKLLDTLEKNAKTN